jgi:hypothetical protein
MATDRAAVLSVPAAAAMLLWPALWNGYPIVFADTGTYLSQAIHHYAGWDRPVFYSMFMLPLHATVTTRPVVAVQALLAAWILRLVCRALAPELSEAAFLALMAALSLCTWLPWIACELMPDVFTPLLVLVLCLLALVPERMCRWERIVLAGLATFMIASQLSSLPLAFVLGGVLPGMRQATRLRQRSQTSRSASPDPAPALRQPGQAPLPPVSWPALRRPSTTLPRSAPPVVDGRAKHGHDTVGTAAFLGRAILQPELWIRGEGISKRSRV